LVAVIEKQLGLQLLGHDIFMNVAGGVKIDEPAVDMGIVAAVASSFLNKPIPEGTLVLGEVGLTGEVRGVGQVETRLQEAQKMGFTRCLVPHSNRSRLGGDGGGMRVTGIRTVSEGVENLF
jgi:DNA repair protein RadA/Sms